MVIHLLDKIAIYNHLEKLVHTQVKKNSALVEETVYQMLQEALFQLQDETQRKLNMMLGEELELRRRFVFVEDLDRKNRHIVFW